MPQIYRYLKLVFSFWSDEHLPPHVHVTNKARSRETIFDLIMEKSVLVEIRKRNDEKPPLSPAEERSAVRFINHYYPQIIKKWFEYYVCGEELKPVTIREKVSGEIEIEDTVKHLEELKQKFYPTAKQQAKTSKSAKK
ncbi:MAG: DUF4160 domain-containing protein [Paludibacter sp.]|jgi:hypothetical protein|nr:DUF4160 domain-containing protein [Paludibacter sp.]